MYAILLHLEHYTKTCGYYEETIKAMQEHGFHKQQEGVYFGDVEKVDAVACVLAVMDMAKKYYWFASSVIDIRMLRIEENNDLSLAVAKAVAK